MKNLIIGLVGTIGAGKTTVAQKLETLGFINFRFSKQLEEEILAVGLKLERINYQNIADQLRKEKGSDYLSRRLLDKINKSYTKPSFVIDGFRNPAEIIPFREKDNFFLIGLNAPEEVRYQRLIDKDNSRSPRSFEDFLKQEKRDNGEGEPEWGLNITECLKQADYIIDTDKSERLVYKEVTDLITKLKGK